MKNLQECLDRPNLTKQTWLVGTVNHNHNDHTWAYIPGMYYLLFCVLLYLLNIHNIIIGVLAIMVRPERMGQWID